MPADSPALRDAIEQLERVQRHIEDAYAHSNDRHAPDYRPVSYIRVGAWARALLDIIAALSALADSGASRQVKCPVDAVAWEVAVEVKRAQSLFGPFKNGHEGYAVILEEVDELWDEVKNNKQADHVARQRKEAIQIAAMAMRYVVDLGHLESTR